MPGATPNPNKRGCLLPKGCKDLGHLLNGPSLKPFLGKKGGIGSQITEHEVWELIIGISSCRVIERVFHSSPQDALPQSYAAAQSKTQANWSIALPQGRLIPHVVASIQH